MNCTHEKKEYRKVSFLVKGQKKFHKVLQCLVCGERMKHGPGVNVFFPISQGDEFLEEQDYEIQKAWREKEQKEFRTKREDEAAKEFAIKHAEYEEYIRTSPKWQQIRRRVLDRAHRICECCLLAPATQVHHTNYLSLFEEIAWDLRAVCGECHTKIHLRRLRDEASNG